ncbi:glycosyltransferase [Alkalimonas sp. MEB108]|uniref:Glycosyltransferase n=1 Tax=Alkalimonas cellulosilytica TaxID=3058395 RepID=A0ABU7J1P2_9GAMM|nr:glycosyltransferase [Alkalimonas sp. MEB108]MEE2000428.1 glycosyltransferase [Alkalimonas sp. MEB108]
MENNVLMIAAEFPPCGGGGVGRVSALARYLIDKGYRVTVLTASENHYAISDPSLVFEHPNLSVVRLQSPTIKTWQWRLKQVFPFISFDDNYILWRRFAIHKAKQLHRQAPFDVVVSSYPCTSNHAVAYAVAKTFSVPWCADYRDPPWWLYSESHKQQPQFYDYANLAAHNVVTTSQAKQLISQKLAVSEHDITVVQNGCHPMAASIPIAAPASEGFELIHTGSFYEEGRDINELIRAVDAMDSAITLRFIGDKPYSTTKTLLESLTHPERVTFTSYIPSNEVLTISAAAAALVVIQGDLFTNQIPGKVYEYLALQKPILLITNTGSATYELMHNEPNVICAEYGNYQSIADAILKLKHHKVVMIDRQRYTRDKMAQKFEWVICNLLK